MTLLSPTRAEAQDGPLSGYWIDTWNPYLPEWRAVHDADSGRWSDADESNVRATIRGSVIEDFQSAIYASSPLEPTKCRSEWDPTDGIYRGWYPSNATIQDVKKITMRWGEVDNENCAIVAPFVDRVIVRAPILKSITFVDPVSKRDLGSAIPWDAGFLIRVEVEDEADVLPRIRVSIDGQDATAVSGENVDFAPRTLTASDQPGVYFSQEFVATRNPDSSLSTSEITALMAGRWDMHQAYAVMTDRKPNLFTLITSDHSECEQTGAPDCDMDLRRYELLIRNYGDMPASEVLIGGRVVSPWETEAGAIDSIISVAELGCDGVECSCSRLAGASVGSMDSVFVCPFGSLEPGELASIEVWARLSRDVPDEAGVIIDASSVTCDQRNRPEPAAQVSFIELMAMPANGDADVSDNVVRRDAPYSFDLIEGFAFARRDDVSGIADRFLAIEEFDSRLLPDPYLLLDLKGSGCPADTLAYAKVFLTCPRDIPRERSVAWRPTGEEGANKFAAIVGDLCDVAFLPGDTVSAFVAGKTARLTNVGQAISGVYGLMPVNSSGEIEDSREIGPVRRYQFQAVLDDVPDELVEAGGLQVRVLSTTEEGRPVYDIYDRQLTLHRAAQPGVFQSAVQSLLAYVEGGDQIAAWFVHGNPAFEGADRLIVAGEPAGRWQWNAAYEEGGDAPLYRNADFSEFQMGYWLSVSGNSLERPDLSEQGSVPQLVVLRNGTEFSRLELDLTVDAETGVATSELIEIAPGLTLGQIQPGDELTLTAASERNQLPQNIVILPAHAYVDDLGFEFDAGIGAGNSCVPIGSTGYIWSDVSGNHILPTVNISLSVKRGDAEVAVRPVRLQGRERWYRQSLEFRIDDELFGSSLRPGDLLIASGTVYDSTGEDDQIYAVTAQVCIDPPDDLPSTTSLRVLGVNESEPGVVRPGDLMLGQVTFGRPQFRDSIPFEIRSIDPDGGTLDQMSTSLQKLDEDGQTFGSATLDLWESEDFLAPAPGGRLEARYREDLWSASVDVVAASGSVRDIRVVKTGSDASAASDLETIGLDDEFYVEVTFAEVPETLGPVTFSVSADTSVFRRGQDFRWETALLRNQDAPTVRRTLPMELESSLRISPPQAGFIFEARYGDATKRLRIAPPILGEDEGAVNVQTRSFFGHEQSHELRFYTVDAGEYLAGGPRALSNRVQNLPAGNYDIIVGSPIPFAFRNINVAVGETVELEAPSDDLGLIRVEEMRDSSGQIVPLKSIVAELRGDARPNWACDRPGSVNPNCRFARAADSSTVIELPAGTYDFDITWEGQSPYAVSGVTLGAGEEQSLPAPALGRVRYGASDIDGRILTTARFTALGGTSVSGIPLQTDEIDSSGFGIAELIEGVYGIQFALGPNVDPALSVNSIQVGPGVDSVQTLVGLGRLTATAMDSQGDTANLKVFIKRKATADQPEYVFEGRANVAYDVYPGDYEIRYADTWSTISEVSVASGEMAMAERNRVFGEISVEIPPEWREQRIRVTINGREPDRSPIELDPGEYLLAVELVNGGFDYYQSVRVEPGVPHVISTASMGAVDLVVGDAAYYRDVHVYRLLGQDQSSNITVPHVPRGEPRRMYLSPGSYLFYWEQRDRTTQAVLGRPWARDIEISAGQTVEITVGD